ncbi:predicted protein [Postia placenta Mad-698-R]|nr:predicted protein [Postia placenta Mad-698-R]
MLQDRCEITELLVLGSRLLTSSTSQPDEVPRRNASRLIQKGDTSTTTHQRKRSRIDDLADCDTSLSRPALTINPTRQGLPQCSPTSTETTRKELNSRVEDAFDWTDLAHAFGLDPAVDTILSHQPEVSLDGADDEYWIALSSVGGVFRLDTSLYVLQDWDSREQSLKIGAYYHIVCLPYGPTQLGVACTCPLFKAQRNCTHRRVLLARLTTFTGFLIISPMPIPPAVFLHSTPFRDVYIFSCVSSTGRHESGKRVIVTLQRDGRWHYFAATAGFIMESPDSQVIGGDADVEGSLLWRLAGRPHKRGTQCCCGQTLPSELSSTSAIVFDTHPAVLYGLTMRNQVSIEVYPCPSCHHHQRFIGPDLGCEGIFNWNNLFLFTHELLNAYTNAFTASETPFSAFCLTVQHSYEDAAPDMQFCSNETFVLVWFAFVRLQSLDSKMQCPTCGPCPKVVIADGVSLGTHISKVTTAVRPPTFTHDGSEKIDTITSWKARSLPAIIQKEIRTFIYKVLDQTATQVSFDIPNLSELKLSTEYPAVASLLQLVLRSDLASPFHKAYREFVRQEAPSPSRSRSYIPFNGSLGVQKMFLADSHFMIPHHAIRLIYSSHGTKPELAMVILKCENDAYREESGDCNKFYKSYSRNNLTGGILIL